MNFPKKIKNKGFTLVETLGTMALAFIVVSSLMLILSTGLQGVREIQQRQRIHAHAITLSEQARYLLKRADVVNINSDTEIEVELPDSTTKVITKSGNDLYRGGAIMTQEDIRLSYLSMRGISDSVQIGFTFVSDITGETFSATTTVFQRNPS
jgi:type II secretory pathway pseudopilin PulG